MGVDILGFDNVPRFEIGLSPGGFILLGIYALATIASLLRSRHHFRGLGLRRGLLLAILTLAAPLLTQVFILQVDAGASGGAGVALLSLLPVTVAAIWLGSGPAILVGLATGVGSAAWDTFRITQPFELALWAGVISMLLRQRYRGTVGSSLRRPLVSVLLSGLLIGYPLAMAAIATAGPRSWLAGLEYALALAQPTLTAYLSAALVTGLLLEGLLLSLPDWRPVSDEWLIAPPWQRKFSNRLMFPAVALAVTSFIILVGSVTYAAFRVATNVVIDQMVRDAETVSNGVPFLYRPDAV